MREPGRAADTPKVNSTPNGEDAPAERPGDQRSLRPLIELARAMGAVRRLDDVLALTAEEARRAVGASAVSISRWEPQQGVLRVLINAGALSRDEQQRPENEVYSPADYPRVRAMLGEGGSYLIDVDDPAADQPERDILRRSGRASAIGVPLIIDGTVWGELFVARDPGEARYRESDVPHVLEVAAQVAAGIAQADFISRVSRLAYSDSLTGLANRRAVDERLAAALERHAETGSQVVLVMGDVNGMKRVNDERGHDAGDRVLVYVADALQAAAARVPGSLAARIGGDEFALVVEGHPTEAAVEVADLLSARVTGLRGALGISCGIASVDQLRPEQLPGARTPQGSVRTGREAAAALLRLADVAQYHAKRAGLRRPVVAGRPLPLPGPDAPVAAEPRGPAAAAAASPPPDRRQLRGLSHLETGRLLVTVLRELDALPPVPVADRVAFVATTVADLVDAAGWWATRIPDATGTPTEQTGTWYRRAGEPGLAERTFPADFSAIRGVLAGGSVLIDRADPAADGDEVAALDALGHSALLAAGAPADGESWLVEIFGDELSAALADLGPALRALLAVAVNARHP